MAETARSSASFRDPSGFIYFRGGECFRQVNRSYAGQYTRLMESGLYQGLAGDGLLIPHEEVGEPPLDPATAHAVLRPQRVPFISYPYEWSFLQLKDAALLTLEIQRRALTAGLALKDASAYNVQFVGGRPVFIDTLSFEEYAEGRPWVAYRQFCQHFLAPLALMAAADVRLNQLVRGNVDGVPLDLASALLPWRTRLRPSLLMHVHLHARAQQRHADDHARTGGASAAPEGRAGRFGRRALEGLIDSLGSAVEGLRWAPRGRGAGWADYYATHTYTGDELGRKERLVAEYLGAADPATVWDLGANTGRFSRVAAARGVPTVAFDVDPACVEANYLEVKRRGERNVLPLVLDLFNPSPGVGWRNRERDSLADRGPAGAVLALALVHHLNIGGGLPMGMVAAMFAELGRWLVVEHVPPEDPQARRLLAARTATHGDHDRGAFERAFAGPFEVVRSDPVGGEDDAQGRRLYLMRRRGLS